MSVGLSGDPEKEFRTQKIKQLEEEIMTLRIQNDDAELDSKVTNLIQEADAFEQLLALQPYLLVEAFRDAVNFTTEFIKNKSNAELAKVLQFFDGKSQTAKKKQLISLIKEMPCYRTKDLDRMVTMFTCLRYSGKHFDGKNEAEKAFLEKCVMIGFKFE